jgi:lantibiotic biosynthesis protein
METRVWVPIVDDSGKLKSAVLASIEAIANDVLDRSSGLSDVTPHLGSYHEEALLFAYIAVETHENVWRERAIARLNQAIQQISRPGQDCALYGGLCGLGWAVEHISALLGGEEPDVAEHDLNHDTDVVVFRIIDSGAFRGRFDLLSGLVGCGVYFLERYPKGYSRAGLELICSQLDSLSLKDSAGISWRSATELLPEWQRPYSPQGRYDLGMAHGAAGVLQFLSRAIEILGPASGRKALLQGGLQWLLSKANSAGPGLHFTAWVNPDGSSSPSRPVWCYGDLGIAAALSQCLECDDRHNVDSVVDSILRRLSDLEPESFGVQDAGLCHGACGVAHIFNRLYQARQDRYLKELAIEWYSQALNFRQAGVGVGGYPKYRQTSDGKDAWVTKVDFLEGAVGVALSLLSAVSVVEPNWDRLLLLSSPGRRS